jgi:DNA-binding transcriptional MerR regulator
MPIRKIKRYVELAKYGDETLEERYELIKEQRQSVLQQIEQLQYYLQELDYKDWYYQTAIKYGSEEAVKRSKHRASLEPDKIPVSQEQG